MKKTRTNRDRKAFEEYFLALQPRKYEESDLLLKSVKKQLPQLKALLAEASSHWGYEDPVYRFYHASFKVCFLTRTTLKIVGALRELAPHLKLNPMFEQIIVEGTERDLKRLRNRDFPRCIVEAFFHARFMLEMAVRYACLPKSPEVLPSGWAALLYLYNLR